ncbi:MAG: ABC-2 family transporter protein, partial [Nanoarchaeota archaeon]|nr:ABC-2 family transporter protein [Nanoarchaeota archaeon]
IFPFYLLSNSLAFLFLLFFYFLTFHVSLLNFLSSLLFALFGSFIFLLFFFILYSLSFWFKQTTYMFFLVELKNIANKYPLTVSNKFFQFVFTFIFPLIFVVTIPAEILRGNFSFVWILYEIGMLIALALLAAFVWKKGLEHYESGMG